MGEICLFLFLIWMGYFLWMKKKRIASGKVFPKGEKKKLLLLIFEDGVCAPMGVCRKKFGIRMAGKKLERQKRLYPGKGEEEIFYRFYGKTACILSAAFAMVLLLFALGGLTVQKGRLLNGYFLQKEDVLGTQKSIQLQAESEEGKKEVTVEIPAEEYSAEELKQEYVKAETYIEKTYLGENSSADAVQTSLNLISSIPGSALEISWETGIDGLINTDGTLANENLETSQQTQITATISYQEEQKKIVKMLTVLPPYRTKEELFWKEWQAQTEQNKKESAEETYLKLPETIKGQKLTYQEKRVQIGYLFLGIVGFLVVMIPILAEETVRKKMVQREEELCTSYPDFVEQFVLLTGAGLSIKGAWERMVSDYKTGKCKSHSHYIYEEMELTLQEMNNGMSEYRAYEIFGKRTGLLPYMKFCTLMVQNLKKGSDDFLRLLEYEVQDAFRMRKENAKALGEKAGTKLLLPMMLMLIIVFVLIFYAAFQGI